MLATNVVACALEHLSKMALVDLAVDMVRRSYGEDMTITDGQLLDALTECLRPVLAVRDDRPWNGRTIAENLITNQVKTAQRLGSAYTPPDLDAPRDSG